MNWNDIISGLVPVLGSLLITVLTWGAVKLTQYIQAKTKNVLVQGILIRATDAVTTSVKEVSQVYVDAIKEASADGVLTKEEQARALELALFKAKQHLGPHGLQELLFVLGLSSKSPEAPAALDSFLTSRIEATVADLKPTVPQ